MAQTALCIDMGSHSIKLVVSEGGFRGAAIGDTFELPVPIGQESLQERQGNVLRRFVAQNNLLGTDAYLLVHGSEVYVRNIQFPFASLKRAELDSVVGSELEGLLPVDLEDIAYTYEEVPSKRLLRRRANTVGEAAPVETVDTEDHSGLRVLAAAIPVVAANGLLETIRQCGLVAKAFLAGPAAYAQIAERIASVTADGNATLGIIDIGHTRTSFCVYALDRSVFYRTLRMGGQSITAMIQSVLQVDEQTAMEAKHSGEGFNNELIAQKTTRYMESVVQELRRTMRSQVDKLGIVCDRLIVLGGSSRLPGLPEFLQDRLQIPCEPLVNVSLGEGFVTKGTSPAKIDVFAPAMGTVFESGTGKPRFDVRRGPLAYKTSKGFLTEKRGVLASFGIAVVAFATLAGFAAHYKLRKQELALTQRVAIESTALYGQTLTAQTVMELEEDDAKISDTPKMSAYDILTAVNTLLPEASTVTLNVDKIAIKPGKVAIVGRAKASTEIDDIAEQLVKEDCLKKLERGTEKQSTKGDREFSFTIQSTCMGGS